MARCSLTELATGTLKPHRMGRRSCDVRSVPKSKQLSLKPGKQRRRRLSDPRRFWELQSSEPHRCAGENYGEPN